MNTPIFAACIGATAVLATLSATQALAQSPARNDKIMSIAELRACMALEQANKKSAAEIVQEQDGFKRDQDAVKAEQAAVNTANDEVRARSATISAERDAISTLVSALNTRAEAAKTDLEKAEAEADRAKLVERSRSFEQNIDSFNASQRVQSDRVAALNARIDAINLRNKTINDRVEPQQKQAATYRDQCSSRRFREEDEIVIKKELAAGK